MASLTHDDYTVAWICALPLEVAAARVMLNKIHSPLPQPSTDPNAYELGELNGHCIVIACLPSGVYGTISAATIVSRMRTTFPQLQYGLMVGIGGGVPGQNNDIRLGDVVVSKPVGKYNGVIQYDYGKIVQGGIFEPTGNLNKPPQSLLTQISQLEAKQMTGAQDNILKIVWDALKQNPNMKERFSPPEQYTDSLFHSSYHHANKEDTCEKCDKQQLIKRQPRDSRAPFIHYGLIASGNQVMKDSEARDRLGQQYGILCFEMEAAGLMDELPTLVIRGICDYCDSHKQKQWQGYAALTAAAYAKVLLSNILVQQIGRVIPRTTTQSTMGIATQGNDSMNHPCLQALQCPEPFFIKNKLKASKDKFLFEAIKWISDDPQYCRWLNEDKIRLLWIRGGAGKGKTMMSIGLIELLSEDSTSLITYFFCQDADYQLNTIEAIMKGLIWQLIWQRNELLKILQRHWDETYSRFKEKISWESLWYIFLEMLEHCKHQKVYVVVDALDECQYKGMAEFLRLIIRTGLNYNSIRWLLTSRPLDSADQELLNTYEQAGIRLELKSNHLDEAIKIYVAHKVTELFSQRRFGLETQQKIQSELLKKAEGTFLWVSLACKSLEGVLKQLPRDEILLAVRDLPPGLHSFYERMFCQIIQGEPLLVKGSLRLLKVMMLVYRPLNEAEVDSVTGFSEMGLGSELIVDRCASFIRLRGADIEFVHQSSRDFLAELSTLRALAAPSILNFYEQYNHEEIALGCLSYMSAVLKVNLINLPLPSSTRPAVIEVAGGKHAVLWKLNYAATLWAEHLEAAKHTRLSQSVLSDRGQVISFLRMKLLEWLECLSLLSQLPRAIKALQILVNICKNNTLLQSTVSDASRCLLRHYQTILAWPLQLYSSVIIFSPERSLVRTEYNIKKVEKWFKEVPRAEQTWQSLIQTLAGHTNPVLAVAFSPDGKQIASGSDDKTIKLWDAGTGNHQKTLAGHTGPVWTVAFSPDGRQIASGSYDKTIKLWDAGTGDHQKTLAGHTYSVITVAFSPDGKQIASGSDDKTIKLWDAGTGDHQKTLAGHTDLLMTVAFSPDGRQIASGSDDKTIRLWDAGTGNHLMTLAGHTDWVRTVTFSPDGRQIASGSDDKTIRLLDAGTGNHLKTLAGHTYWVRTVTFSPDGRQIASGSYDKTIKIWDTGTGNHLKTLAGHTGPVWTVAFSPDGRQIASGSSDHTIKLWDAGTGDHIKTLAGHADWVRTVAFSPDGKQFASGSYDLTIKLWDAGTGNHQKTLAGHTDLLMTVAFSPDGKHIASGSYDKTIKLWDTGTGDHQKTLAGHTDSVTTVAFSPDGKHIASGSGDHTTKLWDAGTGNHLMTLAGHTDWVRTVTFSPDGRQIASGSDDKTIRLWDAGTGNHLKTLAGHTNWVRIVVFSPDGKQIASGSHDKTIKIWDAGTGDHPKSLLRRGALKKFGKWRHEIPRHEIQTPAPVTKLNFSSDGNFLLTNLGPLKVGSKEIKGGLSLVGDWIWYGLVPILRILPDSKPSCFAVRDDCIVVGFQDGRVLCLHFHCQILDQVTRVS